MIPDVQAASYKLQHFIDCKCFSSLNKLLRTTAYVIRFVKKLLTKVNTRELVTNKDEVVGSLPTVEELNCNLLISEQGENSY